MPVGKPGTGKTAAVAMLVAAAVLWSSGGLLIKWVDLNPMAITGIRSAIAAIVMLPFVKRKNIVWSFPQVAGIFAYAGTVILFVTANKLTTAANAIVLQYTAPVFIAILSYWMLKEKINRTDWVIIVCVMAGMALFFFDKLTTGGMLGNILAILSGLCFGFLIIFLRMQKDGSPLETNFLGNLLTAFIGIPFAIGSHPDVQTWSGLLLLGTLQLGLSYILYSNGIKGVRAIEASLIPMVEPILNPVWVFFAFGEVPGIWAFIGGVIILTALSLRIFLPSPKS